MSTPQRKIKTLVLLGSARPKEPLTPFPGRVATRVGAHIKAQLEDECEVLVVEADGARIAACRRTHNN